MTVHPTLLNQHQCQAPVYTRQITNHISDAVVAPDCSITSGATIGQDINARIQHLLRIYLRTPVRAPHYRVVPYCACRRAACDTEVR